MPRQLRDDTAGGAAPQPIRQNALEVKAPSVRQTADRPTPFQEGQSSLANPANTLSASGGVPIDWSGISQDAIELATKLYEKSKEDLQKKRRSDLELAVLTAKEGVSRARGLAGGTAFKGTSLAPDGSPKEIALRSYESLRDLVGQRFPGSIGRPEDPYGLNWGNFTSLDEDEQDNYLYLIGGVHDVAGQARQIRATEDNVSAYLIGGEGGSVQDMENARSGEDDITLPPGGPPESTSVSDETLEGLAPGTLSTPPILPDLSALPSDPSESYLTNLNQFAPHLGKQYQAMLTRSWMPLLTGPEHQSMARRLDKSTAVPVEITAASVLNGTQPPTSYHTTLYSQTQWMDILSKDMDVKQLDDLVRTIIEPEGSTLQQLKMYSDAAKRPDLTIVSVTADAINAQTKQSDNAMFLAMMFGRGVRNDMLEKVKGKPKTVFSALSEFWDMPQLEGMSGPDKFEAFFRADKFKKALAEDPQRTEALASFHRSLFGESVLRAGGFFSAALRADSAGDDHTSSILQVSEAAMATIVGSLLNPREPEPVPNYRDYLGRHENAALASQVLWYTILHSDDGGETDQKKLIGLVTADVKANSNVGNLAQFDGKLVRDIYGFGNRAMVSERNFGFNIDGSEDHLNLSNREHLHHLASAVSKIEFGQDAEYEKGITDRIKEGTGGRHAGYSPSRVTWSGVDGTTLAVLTTSMNENFEARIFDEIPELRGITRGDGGPVDRKTLAQVYIDQVLDRIKPITTLGDALERSVALSEGVRLFKSGRGQEEDRFQAMIRQITEEYHKSIENTARNNQTFILYHTDNSVTLAVRRGTTILAHTPLTAEHAVMVGQRAVPFRRGEERGIWYQADQAIRDAAQFNRLFNRGPNQPRVRGDEGMFGVSTIRATPYSSETVRRP